MATIKCSICDAVCNTSLTICDTCGSALPVEVPLTQKQQPSGFGIQSGFGQLDTQPVQPSGFNVLSDFEKPALPQATLGFNTPPQSGFNNPLPQSGFNNPLPQSGFNTAPQPTNFDTPIQSGFGTVPQSGFNSNLAPSPLSFGESSSGFDQTAPPSFSTQPQASTDFNGKSADSARFADTIGSVINNTDSIYWGFGQCMTFMLKMFIPIYGLILLIMCAIGNPRIYPTEITNFVRASLILVGIVGVIGVIITVIASVLTADMMAGVIV